MVIQQEKIRTILGLCARNNGHNRMYELLRKELEIYLNNQFLWEELINQAESQGVAPLLYKHVTAVNFMFPGGQHRILRSLYQRSRLANRIRNRVVVDILAAFYQQQIDILLIKGIALASIIYESPGLRPMRDIDLLVRKQDLDTACTILTEQGFIQDSNHDIPHDYYHLPPMQKTVDGLPVNIEIHHELLPPHASYPVWTFESFHQASLSFSINEITASTINLEDSLYYLYLHGIKAPLTYEPFRLIHVADLVSLTETCFEQLDWDKIKDHFPHYLAILSRLHFITPWQGCVLDGLKLDIGCLPHKPGLPYQGWPLLKINNTRVAGLPSLIKETVLPPQWWQQVYYGRIDGLSYLKTRWFDHPRTIWRWIKTYILAWFQKT